MAKFDQSGVVTEALKGLAQGHDVSEAELLDLVYAELKRQAHSFMRKERKNHTLQTTALVHEAYLRIVEQKRIQLENRTQFFALAATMMRRILVNYAKNRNRVKRGGPATPVPLDESLSIAAGDGEIDLLELDDALNGLAKLDEQLARIVELRYFSGLTIKETAEVLKISSSTVKRDWNMAKAWLRAELAPGVAK